MNITEIQDKPIVSFKEVHAELERESALLGKTHDLVGYEKKAAFLTNIGFGSSIATKLYKGIAENLPMIQEMEKKYFNMYKFILSPQLERICEKYDLYVRPLDLFLGDIPEVNIKHLMDFKIKIEDLPEEFTSSNAMKTLIQKAESLDRTKQYSFNGITSNNLYDIIEKFKANIPTDHYVNMNSNSSIKVSLEEINIISTVLRGFGDRNLPILEIAAVPQLFDERAFEKSNKRILDSIAELDSRSQVDLDPIVMIRCKNNTRCIITAWGDEANDELVSNPKMN